LRKIRDSISYFIKETDKILLLLCLITSAFGILMVHSATRSALKDGKIVSGDVRTMVVAVLLGICIALVISFIDYEAYVKLWPAVQGLA